MFPLPYMPCASASDSGPESTLPQFGLLLRFVMPHFILSANGFRIGLALNVSGLFRSDVRGGSRVVGFCFVPRFSRAMFCGAERNSIHFHAASWFLPADGITRASPAMVVAQGLVAVSVGCGATAQLFPICFLNVFSISPANHAPAMYIAVLPVAKVLRAVQESEPHRSGEEYLRR